MGAGVFCDECSKRILISDDPNYVPPADQRYVRCSAPYGLAVDFCSPRCLVKAFGGLWPSDEPSREVSSRRPSRTDLMDLDDILGLYKDGDEHGWDAEFAWLWDNHPEKMQELVRSIDRIGIIVPIELGDDGRVWNGHHRLAAAKHLGIKREIPVRRA